MSYYYPYFYKAHIVNFVNEDPKIIVGSSSNNTSPVSHVCKDENCHSCVGDKCTNCNSGWYLNDEEKCINICPKGYVADNLRRKCFNLNFNLPDISFTKSYSLGSCRNNCFRKSVDCECDYDCKRRGDCCTDFNISQCEEIFSIITNQNKNNTDFNISSINETIQYCNGHLNGCEICEEKTDDSEYDYYLITSYPLRKKTNSEKSLMKPKNLNQDINKSNIKLRKNQVVSNKESVLKKNNQTNSRQNEDLIKENNEEITDHKENNQKNLVKHHVCRQCQSNLYLFNGTCLTECPNKFTPDLYKKECVLSNDHSLSKYLKH